MVVAVLIVEHNLLLNTFFGCCAVDGKSGSVRRRPAVYRSFNSEFQRIQKAPRISCGCFDEMLKSPFRKRNLPSSITPLMIL